MNETRSWSWSAKFNEWLNYFGEFVLFTLRALYSGFQKPYRHLEFIKHFQFVGNRSFLIVTMTGAFTGLALAFQTYLGFKMVNATSLVGPIVALGISRELGPVLTGLIIAARAGGAMTARLGTMRVAEQMDALDVMGVDTYNYLIAPRIAAATLATPLLTALFDFFAILAAYLLVIFLGLDGAIFWERTTSIMKVKYIFEGLFKASVFGFIYASICTYRGFHAQGGAKGVGEATNQGVVHSMVSIIILDYFLTNLIRLFYFMIGSAD